LTYVGSQKEYVEVDLIDLPVHVRRGLLKIQNRKPEVESFLKGDLMARPGQIDIKIEPKEDLYTLPEKFISILKKDFKNLITGFKSRCN